jgi:phosphoglycolate phosphatase
MSEPAAVVVDLDNTLCKLQVDWGAVKERLEELAAAAGVDVEDVGIWPLMEAAQQPGREALLRDMEELVTEAELDGARGCPHNEALVEWIRLEGGGRPVSVLSLNSRRAVERALESNGLGEMIKHVVGREDVRRIKPDPEGMIALADRHGVEPHEMLLVGDKDGDRECAERAGARFLHVEEIGVRWRTQSRTD